MSEITLRARSANPPLVTLRDINIHCQQLVTNADFQIFVDGGVRSGNDILKALYFGADAVGIGRPFIHAAAGWGQEGVAKAVYGMDHVNVLTDTAVPKDEMERPMWHLGVTNLNQPSSAYVDTSGL